MRLNHVCERSIALLPILFMGFLVTSAARGQTTLFTFNGDSAFDFFGISVSGAGDVDDDGFPVFIVGARCDDNNGPESGSARVFSFADDDGDGVPDVVGVCPDSILTETIIIDGCDTGVENVVFEDGCTMMDLINECAASSTNHGSFVSCVAVLANEWKQSGLTSEREKGKIQSGAAQADIP